MSVEFDQFWAAYPKRLGNPKKAALDQWNRLAKAKELPPLETMVAAAKAYAATIEREKTEPRFIAHTRTWLFQQRWNEFSTPKNEVGDRAGNALVTQQNSAIPAIMSPVLNALGPERYGARFGGCAFEECGTVLVIRPKHRFEIERIENASSLVERLTGKRVRVELAA